MRQYIVCITVTISYFFSFAAAEWPKCNQDNNQLFNQRSVPLNNQNREAIYLEANQGVIDPKGVSTLSGDVSLIKGDLRLNAEKVRFDRKKEKIIANQNIIFRANRLNISAEKLNYELKSGKGIIENAYYKLNDSSANGYSKQINLNKTETVLAQTSFSTCSSKNPDWQLTANQLVLNQTFKIGIARNIVFKAGNIPLLYFPYLSFPLDNRRKSGLLIPDIQMTQSSGLEFTLPYYFNLAKNYDLTLSPSLTTQRRLGLKGEFRYLSKNNEAQINFNLIPKDEDYNNKIRGYVEVKYQADITKTLRLSVNAKDVTDKDYLDNYSLTLDEASIAALPRRIDLINKTANWQIGMSIQNYQILDSNNAPYSRVPEVRIRYQPEKPIHQIQYFVEGEVVGFKKKEAINAVRSDFNMKASKRFGDFSWYIEPSLGVRHTRYYLNNNVDLTRTLPTLSIDWGGFFERQLNVSHYLQTLNPRLFYTYTPYKKQSHLPLFDSASMSLGTSTKMFSTNRFSGKDRIADTNRLTASITTELFDTTKGSEQLTASIGQIYYFDDRRVVLNEKMIGESTRSELAVELMGKINNTKLIVNAYWDTKKKQINSGELRLHYKNDKGYIANVSLHHLTDEVDQLGVSFAMPVNEQLSLISKVDYDLDRHRLLEQLVGFEYGTCCWKSRIGARRYLTSDNDSYDDRIFLELELKGLGSVGNGTKHLLEEKVYGYEK